MKALLCTALLLIPIAVEAAERPRMPAVLDEMVKLSGVEERLTRLPEAMMEAFDGETDDRLRDIVRQSYRRDVTFPAFVARSRSATRRGRHGRSWRRSARRSFAGCRPSRTTRSRPAR